MKTTTVTTIIIFFIIASSLLPNDSYAQTRPITLQNALNTALQNNLQLRSANLSVQQRTALQRTAFDVPRTEFALQQTPVEGGSMDNSIGFVQPFLYQQFIKASQSCYVSKLPWHRKKEV